MSRSNTVIDSFEPLILPMKTDDASNPRFYFIIVNTYLYIIHIFILVILNKVGEQYQLHMKLFL